MRLIDADALKAVIEEEEKGLEIFEFQLAATAFINHIEEAPTIDAVPKTQCRDCQFSGRYSGINLRRINATD